MRICIITPEFVTEPYFSGGVAQQFYKIAKWEIGHGHDVEVITLSDRDENIVYDGLTVHRVTPSRSLWLRAGNRLSRYKLADTIRWLRYSWAAYRKARELHRQKSFDIIHSVNSRGCGLISLLFLDIPHVLFVACYRPIWNRLSGAKPTIDARAGEFLELIFYRLASNIFAPSETLKNMLATEANIRNVRVIRTPISLGVSELADSIYEQHLKGIDYLLFFGRLQMHKGAHILGHSLPQVLSRLPKAYAAFVGLDAASPLGPSMREYIRQQCKYCSDRIVFIDALRHEQLYPIISRSRLVVLPSLIDNLPNTCLEAMALGKPVIGTIGASFDELITDGENGFLVPIGDVGALAAKIVEAWTHPDLEAIGEAAMRKTEQFAPEHTVQKLLRYYEDILNDNDK